jgi:hypothetical protein
VTNTDLLAMDSKGASLALTFSSGNNVAFNTYRAFTGQISPGTAVTITNGNVWTPTVLTSSGEALASAATDSFLFRTEQGVASLLIDDDNCDCQTVLNLGSSMCLASGQFTNGAIGVDDLMDDGCGSPQQTLGVNLYLRLRSTDGTAPTATIALASGQSATTNSLPIRFAVTFSEAVGGFTAADLVSNTVQTFTVTQTDNLGAVYEVAVTAATLGSTVSFVLVRDGVFDLSQLQLATNVSSPGVNYGTVVILTPATNVSSLVSADQSTTLAVTVTGTYSSLTITWTFNGNVIAGQTSLSYTFTPADASASGIYVVTLRSEPDGFTAARSFTLDVDPAGPPVVLEARFETGQAESGATPPVPAQFAQSRTVQFRVVFNQPVLGVTASSFQGINTRSLSVSCPLPAQCVITVEAARFGGVSIAFTTPTTITDRFSLLVSNSGLPSFPVYQWGRDWSLIATLPTFAAGCAFSGGYSVVLTAACRSSDCPLSSAERQHQVTLTVSSAQHCPEIVDEIGLVPTLTSFEDLALAVPKDDFVDGQRVYLRATVTAAKAAIRSAALRRVLLDNNAVFEPAASVSLFGFQVHSLGGAAAAGSPSVLVFSFLVDATALAVLPDRSREIGVTALIEVVYESLSGGADSGIELLSVRLAEETPPALQNTRGSSRIYVTRRGHDGGDDSEAASGAGGVFGGMSGVTLAAVGCAFLAVIVVLVALVRWAARRGEDGRPEGEEVELGGAKSKSAAATALAPSSSSSSLPLAGDDETGESAEAPSGIVAGVSLRDVQTHYDTLARASAVEGER